MDVKKIKVYDLDAFFRAEFDLEAFNFKQIAVFEGTRGVIVAEHEAVHLREYALTDTVEMKANPIAKQGEMWIVPTMVVQARIEELMQAPSTEMTLEEFFDRRDYNPRCQTNYRHLMEHLREIGFDLHGYFPQEKAPLIAQIHSATARQSEASAVTAPHREQGQDR